MTSISRWIGASFLSCILLSSGCGTIGNIVGVANGATERVVYGGVRGDWDAAWDLLVAHEKYLDELPFLGETFALDLPLSAVGDTLTLPITVPAELIGRYRRNADGPRSSDSEE
jgi:uncharacterized protein YceK